MQFSIVVYGAPEQSEGAWSAYQFACATLAAGHSIYRVFFYHHGVANGSSASRPPQDERNLPELWSQLARDHKLDLVVCISAAKRRGVFNATEASRYGSNANLADGFELSGLGQYTDALLVSDRTITFGD
jgi:tRNA 2-thiouridine synthesizing protein D